MCKTERQSAEAAYIELHHALVLITHECEDFLAEEIGRDRQPMIAALKKALDLMEQSGQVAFFQNARAAALPGSEARYRAELCGDRPCRRQCGVAE